MDSNQRNRLSSAVLTQRKQGELPQDIDYLAIEEENSVYEFDLNCLNNKTVKKKVE